MILSSYYNILFMMIGSSFVLLSLCVPFFPHYINYSSHYYSVPSCYLSLIILLSFPLFPYSRTFPVLLLLQSFVLFFGPQFQIFSPIVFLHLVLSHFTHLLTHSMLTLYPHHPSFPLSFVPNFYLLT